MFLACTALDDYWAINEKILFAGQWCLLYDKTLPKELQYEVLPYLWTDIKEVHKAQVCCQDLYEYTLPILVDSLNGYLNQNESIDYYRVLLGNWLVHFIHQTYDKFCILKECLKYDDYIWTWTLNSSHFFFPNNFAEYSKACFEDAYHLQQFSTMISILGIESVEKNICVPSLDDCVRVRGSLKELCVNLFKRLCHKVFLWAQKILTVFGSKRVVIAGPYFKKGNISKRLSLFLRSKGKFIFDDFVYPLKSLPKNTDTKFRFSQIKKSYSGKIEEWIVDYVLMNIPKCYFEYHKQYKEASRLLYKSQRQTVFFTYNELYHNVIFQYRIAQRAKYESIYSAQHGSAYGMDMIHHGEAFERSVSDRFYTYGWAESNQTRPLPMPQLVREHIRYKANRKILLVTSSRMRYVFRIQAAPTSSKSLIDHVDFPVRFITKLKVVENLVVRHHSMHDCCKWFNKQRIEDSCGKGALKDDNTLSFYSSLRKTRIFVSDHLGTTFLEAMQSNVPTILFINKTSYMFRKSFQGYVKKLIQNKILFFSPEDAAEHLNEVFEHVSQWWESDSLQQFRVKFVEKYAYTCEDWHDVWIKELLS